MIGASVFPVSSEGPPYLVASLALTTREGMRRTYFNPDPQGSLTMFMKNIEITHIVNMHI
jgi:hypothetical protein